MGVLAALMALQLERTRELGVLRALGLTPRQVGALVTAQTGLMGLVAGLLAVPVGVALAAVLVFVINRRSFGWTMPLDVRPRSLLQALLLAVGWPRCWPGSTPRCDGAGRARGGAARRVSAAGRGRSGAAIGAWPCWPAWWWARRC